MRGLTANEAGQGSTSPGLSAWDYGSTENKIWMALTSLRRESLLAPPFQVGLCLISTVRSPREAERCSGTTVLPPPRVSQSQTVPKPGDVISEPVSREAEDQNLGAQILERCLYVMEGSVQRWQ